MLNNPYVRTVVFSRVLLNLGIWVRNFAILLYVTDMTDNNPVDVSLISVAEFAPIFLFAFIGGTFADRWRPKRTMVCSDVLSALSVFFVLITVHNGSWQALLVLTFFSATVSQFSQPSALKLFKQHVPAEQLQSVMAMFQSMVAFFTVIGPIAGAFIYQKYGIEISLIATGMLFLGSGLILALLPRDMLEETQSKRQNLQQELIEGLRYVWSNQTLRTLGAAFAAAGLASGLIQPLAIFVTMENLGQAKSFLQWLLTVNGVAMLVGGGFVMAFAKKIPPQTLLALGLSVSAIGNLGIGWSTSIMFTLLLLVLNGFFYPTIHIGINTLILNNTEGPYIGRVGGALTPIFMGMMVLGMSLGGLLKNQLSLFFVYAVSALLLLIGSGLLIPLFKKKTSTAGVLEQ